MDWTCGFALAGFIASTAVYIWDGVRQQKILDGLAEKVLSLERGTKIRDAYDQTSLDASRGKDLL